MTYQPRRLRIHGIIERVPGGHRYRLTDFGLHSGLTGQTIVRAILAGERVPEKLASLSHPGIHPSKAEVVRSLEGKWSPELLFVLQ